MTTTLVTVADYRALTQDNVTTDGAVSARLEEALEGVEEYLERRLELGTYTDTFVEVSYDERLGWLVYPQNTPVHSTVEPVGLPITLDGAAVLWMGGTWDALMNSYAPFTLSYTGGFTHDTLPALLRRVIILLAQAMVKVSPLTPYTASAIRVGDISVTYPKPQALIDQFLPGITQQLKTYRKRYVL